MVDGGNWNIVGKLDKTFIDNWIESMPRRLNECIKPI